MRVPVWLTLGVAALVVIFGVYRIRLAFRSAEEDARARARKGMYGLARRTHALVGIVYLLLGTALIATSFGWSPLGQWFGPRTTPGKPPPARPTSVRMPIDHLPPPPGTGATPAPTPDAPPAPAAPAPGTTPAVPADGSAATAAP